MGRRVLVIGGSGLVGEPIVRRLVESGAEVLVATRGHMLLPLDLSAEVRSEMVDRRVVGELDMAVGEGVDALVDVIPYRVEDARQLLSLEGRVGTIVAISSASVYAGSDGRSLLEGLGETDRPVPISESAPTAHTDTRTYSGRKAAIEELLLDQTQIPMTVLRPGAIYGPQDPASREWYFVKRVLDDRDKIVLAYSGGSRFHHVAAENVAELVRLAVERPGPRVLNAADEEAHTVAMIGRAVAKLMDHRWQETLLQGPPTDSGVGDTPWTTRQPFVLDMTAARRELGYRDVVSYENALLSACDWLQREVDPRDWEKTLPRAAEYYGSLFEYEAEDRLIAEMKR
jgi:nucleoside-diphosphate-sugar epimerase